MANVLHFMTDADDKAACGTQVFLCSDYTDEPSYVDCKRCKKTKKFIDYDPRRFLVIVWDHEGDIIRQERNATADEADAIREEYQDDPTTSVTVEEV